MCCIKYILLFLYCFIYSGLHAQIKLSPSSHIQSLIDSVQYTPTSEQTFTWAEELLTLAEQEKNIEGKIAALHEQGNFYNNVNAPEKSLVVYEALYHLGKTGQDEEVVFDALFGMGWACSSMYLSEEALSYFGECEQMAAAKKDSVNLILIYDGIGVLYLHTEDFQQALYYFSKAKTIATQINHTDIGVLNSNIALAYAQTGKADLAIPLLEQILQEEQNNKDSIKFALSYSNLGYGYQSNKNFEKALMYYDTSLFYSEKFDLDGVTFLTYLDISETYELQQDYTNSLLYHKKYQALRDTIFSYRTKRHTNALDKHFQKERRQKELLLKEKKVQQLRFGIASLVALLVIGLLLFLKRRERIQQELKRQEINEQLIRSDLENKQLEAKQLTSALKNKESDLTNLALDIARKNKFYTELVEQLSELQKSDPKQLQKELRSTIFFVNNNLRISDDLEQLQVNITEINQAFYEKLDAQFDNLSINDKYVLGLIRLNLSNKDIAIIKNISPATAKTARHRLRKKLKLSPKMDLVRFLQGF